MRRSESPFSLAILVTTLAIALWAAPGAAQTLTSSEPKVVTQTFHSNTEQGPSKNAFLTANPGSTTVGAVTGTYPLTFNIPATPGTISNVRATVRITHPNVSELQILVVSPTGDAVEILQSHNAASYNTQAANNDTFIFDSRAAAAGDGSYGGYMKPNNAGFANVYPAPAPVAPHSKTLAAFNGDSPTGIWSIYCHDKFPMNGTEGAIAIDKIEIETVQCGVIINDNSLASVYPLNINVAGATGNFVRARLTINNLSHTRPNDLRFLLVSPTGEKLMLMNNCGDGSDIVNQDITFTDNARFAPSAFAIITNEPNVFAPTTYGANPNMPGAAPAGPYATSFSGAFAASALNGNWALFAADDNIGDVGCFESATLEVFTSDSGGFLGSVSNVSETDIVPAGSATAWSNIGLTPANAWVETSSGRGYFAFPITAHPTKVRTSGLIRNRSGWILLNTAATQASDFFGFFSVSRSGQPNPADLNQIPNMRLRLQQRFAANSMLEVFNHTGDNPTQTAMEQELRPTDYSTTQTSTYIVASSPIITPRSTAANEGIQSAFEAFSTLPQDAGELRLQNLVLVYSGKGLYPTETVPKSDFVPTSSNAGTLQVYNPAAELQNYAVNYGAAADDPPVIVPGVGGTYVEDNFGITLSTAGQETSPPVRIVSRNIHPEGGGVAYSGRARVFENYLYAARFHVTATRIAPFQSQVRFRARTIKFAYSQKLEIGGTYAAGSLNNALARQFAPGFGTLNQDLTKPGDPGVWYTLKMFSPLYTGIRPEFAFPTPIATRMPNITAQPGPGAPFPSRRDIFLGLDILDTLSTAAGFENEASQITVDHITLHEHPFGFGLTASK